MEWFIISRDMHVLCNPSTDAEYSLPIDDSGVNYGQRITLANNVAIGTYDFKTFPDHEDSKYITEGNYIAFKDKYGKDRLYTIMSIEGDEKWDVHCEDIGLDLINEVAGAWNVSAEPVETTMNRCLHDTGWSIGVNEIADRKRATKYESRTDSHLARIGMIMNAFDAECEFVIEMNGAKVTKQVVNIYKSLGEDKVQQVFIDDIDLIALSRSGSIEDLCTCMICYGKEENGVRTTIESIEYDDGRYYSPKGHIRIYDREAHQKWSRYRAYDYTGQGEFDGYVNGAFEYETDSPQELFNRGLSELKQRNDKKVSYEAELYDLQADIGDTIRIADNRYQEKLYLSARVQEVQNHYTVNGEDTGKLANYSLMESKRTQDVEDMLKELQGKVVSIDHAEISYQIGESGTEPPDGEWSSEPVDAEAGKYLWTRTITYYTNSSRNTAYSIAKSGLNGEKGESGDKGDKGDTGSAGASLVTLITSYSYNQTEIDTYAKDGYSGSWYVTSTSGVKVNDTVLLRVRNTTKNGYCYIIAKVTEVESSTRVTATSQGVVDKGNTGDKGDKGETGPQGPQGVQGVKGTDGKTYYTWIKYADSPTSGMSDNPSGKKYIGVAYNKTTATESTKYSDYSWSLIKGDKGDKGDKGETGGIGPTGNGIKSIAYYYARTTSQTAPSAASITATSIPTLDATNKYLWQKEVITYTNNTSQTSVLLLAVYGNTGAKGDKGDTGPAGKGISSTEVTYQASTSGTSIPTGTWVTSIPSVAAGSYLWTRTIITYTDKTSTTSYAVGKMGNTGATGKGIKSTSITYQAHSNGTTAPTGTWTDLVPATSAEKPYLWSRTILTYTDNTTSTTYSVGSTPDGVLEEIRKVLRYDNTKIVLGQDGEPTSLELTNEGLTVKSDSEDIISVTGENREVTSDYNPSGTTFTRRYGKVINADGTIISCGNTVTENDYEIAEMVQYTGVDPLLSGHEAGIDITAKIAGVDSGTNKTETDTAQISIYTIRNSKAPVHSRIDSDAEWICFRGKQIKFYPTDSFGIDGASIAFKGKGIGLYPTEELELGIPVVTGDCNKLTKSCTWYLGNNSTNRPLNQNGWLISRPYSTDYCHQTYITNTGGIYRRMMQAGKWGIWQGGYANVKKLWSGTLSKGGSVTVANLSLFDTFILGTSSGTAMLIGTRYYDQNQNRGTTVLFTAGHDDGTTSYLYKATTSMSGTTFRLTSCSVHTLDPTGCGGHAATVKSLYGVM
ncbi:phage minor structural protein%2C N-terminal region [Allocoprococcus comes]|jgi:phage minor structural protein|uniref:Phage minor structural protein, N-terminal region n=1 Tax=Coprococcus comes TaxID=410072 RepID=A0AA37V3Y4_9FIRM|nr:phage tail spike protein [Coprococcus comes]GLG86905.1 hypothetical protein comes_14500 [Coprococcus comes]CUN64322.1 phage minor structural protein%2C N-terminal region [Coprococcus comes]